jgi:DNA polymerase-3 subunit beta
MKITLDAPTFADAIGWAGRLLPTGPVTPVLANILLEARDDDGEGTLHVSVFDYVTSARCAIPGIVAEPGRILLPGRVLTAVAKTLPAKPLGLAVTTVEAALTCGGAEFTLPAASASTYPTLPETPAASGTIDGDLLRRAVAQVHPAVDHAGTRPEYTGIHLTTGGGALKLTGTDSYRIATQTIPWQPAIDGTELDCLVYADALREVSKGLAGTTQVGVTDGLISLAGQGRTSTIRLLGEEFRQPPTRDEFPAWAELDTAELRDAVRALTVVADKTSPVALDFDTGQVRVHAAGELNGRGALTLDADFDAGPLSVSFQVPWLLDGLTGVEDERVRIGAEGPGKAALIRGAGDASAYRYLTVALRA